MWLLTGLVAAIAFTSLGAARWPGREEYRSRGESSRGYGHPRCHDNSFIPDYTLHLTYENISIGCQHRPSVVVNGSLPGPELWLKPGRTSWIRVYNDMTDFNATVVSSWVALLTSRNTLIFAALAWT